MSDIAKIFNCTRCGFCCQGETTVSLDAQDQQRMCSALGSDSDEVSKKFWRVTDNVVQMKIVDGHCIFYADGCTVHTGRPWRCAEWPLHPSILDDINNYHTIAESCPGINTEIGYEEFCAVLKKIFRETARVHC
jgi:Fe-S-cluster containining protein